MSVIRGARLVVFDEQGQAPKLRATVTELSPKPGSRTPGLEFREPLDWRSGSALRDAPCLP